MSGFHLSYSLTTCSVVLGYNIVFCMYSTHLIIFFHVEHYINKLELISSLVYSLYAIREVKVVIDMQTDVTGNSFLSLLF